MTQLPLNLIAIFIFLITLSTLLGPMIHLSPFVPVAAIVTVLGLASLDQFGWQGRGSLLLLDWLARFSAEHRDRVTHHEAGHFLVAHQLGIPITGYTLSAWEAFQQGQGGHGGVQVNSQDLETELRQGVVSDQLLDQYCTVWMAGMAAQTLVYGNPEGGMDDRQALKATLSNLGLSTAEYQQKERLYTLRAKTLIEDYRPAYDALVASLQRRAPVADCIQAIEAHTTCL